MAQIGDFFGARQNNHANLFGKATRGFRHATMWNLKYRRLFYTMMKIRIVIASKT